MFDLLNEEFVIDTDGKIEEELSENGTLEKMIEDGLRFGDEEYFARRELDEFDFVDEMLEERKFLLEKNRCSKEEIDADRNFVLWVKGVSDEFPREDVVSRILKSEGFQPVLSDDYSPIQQVILNRREYLIYKGCSKEDLEQDKEYVLSVKKGLSTEGTNMIKKVKKGFEF